MLIFNELLDHDVESFFLLYTVYIYLVSCSRAIIPSLLLVPSQGLHRLLKYILILQNIVFVFNAIFFIRIFTLGGNLIDICYSQRANFISIQNQVVIEMIESSAGYQGIIVEELVVGVSIFSVVIEQDTELIRTHKQLVLSIWIRINTGDVLIGKTLY